MNTQTFRTWLPAVAAGILGAATLVACQKEGATPQASTTTTRQDAAAVCGPVVSYRGGLVYVDNTITTGTPAATARPTTGQTVEDEDRCGCEFTFNVTIPERDRSYRVQPRTATGKALLSQLIFVPAKQGKGATYIFLKKEEIEAGLGRPLRSCDDLKNAFTVVKK